MSADPVQVGRVHVAASAAMQVEPGQEIDQPMAGCVRVPNIAEHPRRIPWILCFKALHKVRDASPVCRLSRGQPGHGVTHITQVHPPQEVIVATHGAAPIDVLNATKVDRVTQKGEAPGSYRRQAGPVDGYLMSQHLIGNGV